MAWPSISLPDSLSESFERAQYQDEFETGRVASRPRQTSTRRKFRLGWSSMSSADLSSLQAAYDSDVGGEFDWQHPDSGIVYTVIYYSGIATGFGAAGYHQVSVEIGER